MQRARTITLRHRASIQPSIAVAVAGPPPPPHPRSWCRWLAPWWARPYVGRGQPRPRRGADHEDAHYAHGQLRPADHPLDLLARACSYDLQIALYHLML
jgi:hypothetical protein